MRVKELRIMKIEKANKNDLKEILDLQYLAYETEGALYHNDAIQPLTQTLEELEEEFNEQIIHLQEIGVRRTYICITNWAIGPLWTRKSTKS